MPYWEIDFFDFSYWQGDINIGAIEDEYVLMRITSGGTYRDTRFHENYDKAIAAEKKVLVYVVINPLFSPEAHWVNFIEHLGYREIVSVVFDVELTGGMSNAVINSRCRDTINLFRQNFGFDKTKIIYTAKWFWDRYIGNVSWAKEFVLHVAQYPGYPPNEDLPAYARPTVIPSPWEQGEAWQWTDKGYFPEITRANIDRNVGNAVFVSALGGITPPEPPPPPPPPVQLLTVYASQAVKVRSGAGIQYSELDILYPSVVDYPVYKEMTGDNGVDKWVNISVRGQTAWCARIWKNPYTGVTYELMKFVDGEYPEDDTDPNPPSDPNATMEVRVKVDKTVAWEITTITEGKPVIETNAYIRYGRRDDYQWIENDIIVTMKPPAITSHGNDKFFKLPFLSPENKLMFVRKDDVVQVV